MDSSRLNRLKEKLEQATSALQVANISAEIEKEERRMQEAEESEKHKPSNLSPRQKVESFIARGKIIMKEEYHKVPPGIVMPDYISGPKSELWFNEINIFNSRFLKDHPLYGQIAAICKTHGHMYNPHEKMMGYLQALIVDDGF